jgi:hypothetical protein
MGIKFLIENSTGEIMDVFSYLKSLEKRIVDLENENVGTTNALYEIENKIDMTAQPSYNEEEPPRMCGEMIFLDDEDEDV